VPGCQRDRGHSGAVPCHDAEQPRASVELLPTWVLAQKVAANHALTKEVRQRLAEGQRVARTYQPDGLAWLERQAEAAEAIIAARQAPRPRPPGAPA
jgi:hypothetical protein